MIPGVTIDLRGYDFETHAQMERLVGTMVPAFQRGFPGLRICALVISDHQQKMLRLERYMKGEPIGVVKTLWVHDVNGIPVAVVGDDQPIRCACGNIHDDNQPWYG